MGFASDGGLVVEQFNRFIGDGAVGGVDFKKHVVAWHKVSKDTALDRGDEGIKLDFAERPVDIMTLAGRVGKFGVVSRGRQRVGVVRVAGKDAPHALRERARVDGLAVGVWLIHEKSITKR